MINSSAIPSHTSQNSLEPEKAVPENTIYNRICNHLHTGIAETVKETFAGLLEYSFTSNKITFKISLALAYDRRGYEAAFITLSNDESEKSFWYRSKSDIYTIQEKGPMDLITSVIDNVKLIEDPKARKLLTELNQYLET